MAKRLLFCVTVAVAALALLSAERAVAQVSEEATARALFEEGLDLAAKERFEEAADRFRRAHALVQTPIVQYNFALALTRSGELAEAYRILRALVRAPDTSDDIQKLANELLEEVTASMSKVVIEPPSGGTEGLTVSLDGEDLAPEALGIEVAVDPGDHRLVVTRADAAGSPRVVYEEGFWVGEGSTHRTAIVESPPTPSPTSLEVGQAAGPARGEPAGSVPGPAVGLDGQTDSEDEEDGAALWLALAAGALAVGAAVLVVILLAGGDDDDQPPLEGTANPVVLVFD